MAWLSPYAYAQNGASPGVQSSKNETLNGSTPESDAQRGALRSSRGGSGEDSVRASAQRPRGVASFRPSSEARNGYRR